MAPLRRMSPHRIPGSAACPAPPRGQAQQGASRFRERPSPGERSRPWSRACAYPPLTTSRLPTTWKIWKRRRRSARARPCWAPCGGHPAAARQTSACVDLGRMAGAWCAVRQGQWKSECIARDETLREPLYAVMPATSRTCVSCDAATAGSSAMASGLPAWDAGLVFAGARSASSLVPRCSR